MAKNTQKKQDSLEKKYQAGSLEEALKKLQELSLEKKRNFIESVDLAINLGIDAKQSDQAVKGSVLLPHGSGKKVKVAVFATEEAQQKAALDAGASVVGFEDLIAKIESGFLDFDCCIATPDAMRKISKIARKLGPRGLMPSPKNGTVTTDIEKAVSDSLKGKINLKNDKAGTIHCLVGKVDFEVNALIENIQSVIKIIKELKPESSKGKYIKGFFLSATMGPSIQVAVESL